MHTALTNSPVLFALDWGTSSLRAYAMGPGGQVLATRRSEHGVMNLPAGPAIHTPAEAFEAALQTLCGDWLTAHADTPLIACGMVGSAQGWREARYQPLPARASELATAMTVIARPGGRPRRMAMSPCVDSVWRNREERFMRKGGRGRGRPDRRPARCATGPAA